MIAIERYAPSLPGISQLPFIYDENIVGVQGHPAAPPHGLCSSTGANNSSAQELLSTLFREISQYRVVVHKVS